MTGWDKAGNSSVDTVQFLFDNYITPQVKVTSPTPDTIITGNEVHIYAEIADVNLDRYRLEYKMQYHTEWQYLHEDTISHSIENKLIYIWKNISDSGYVNLKLIAWDKDDNSASSSVQFLLNNSDYQLPIAIISDPTNNSYINGWLSIKGSATGENFKKYAIFLKSLNMDSLLFESNIKKENEELFSFNSNSFPDDEYKIILIVENQKLYQKSSMISITIDNLYPQAQITYPLSDTISCFVNIQGDVYDKNFKDMTLKYAEISETDSSKFIFIDSTFTEWNTTELDGFYTLYLAVEDKGGLKTVDQRTYYIDNPTIDQRDGFKKEHAEFSLYIPPNGYESSVICLQKMSIDSFFYDYEILKPTEIIVQIHSSINEKNFSRPAVLTVDYIDLDLQNYSEDKLCIFSWQSNDWTLVGGTLDKTNKTISTVIKQIGIYGLFQNNQDSIGITTPLDFNCQPRIFSPKGGGFDNRLAISFELGKNTNVTIKIYNAAGRLVDVLTENQSFTKGSNVVYWDGKDKWGNFCDSGLYIVLIESEEKTATKTCMVLNE